MPSLFTKLLCALCLTLTVSSFSVACGMTQEDTKGGTETDEENDSDDGSGGDTGDTEENELRCVDPSFSMSGCCSGHGGAEKSGCQSGAYQFNDNDQLICEDGTVSTTCTL